MTTPDMIRLVSEIMYAFFGVLFGAALLVVAHKLGLRSGKWVVVVQVALACAPLAFRFWTPVWFDYICAGGVCLVGAAYFTGAILARRHQLTKANRPMRINRRLEASRIIDRLSLASCGALLGYAVSDHPRGWALAVLAVTTAALLFAPLIVRPRGVEGGSYSEALWALVVTYRAALYQVDALAGRITDAGVTRVVTFAREPVVGPPAERIDEADGERS